MELTTISRRQRLCELLVQMLETRTNRYRNLLRAAQKTDNTPSV